MDFIIFIFAIVWITGRIVFFYFEVNKLKKENRELKEKLSNLHIVCEFQEDLLIQQDNNFTDGL